MGATRNTGYLENLIAYDASNNVAIATTAIDNAFKITMGGSVKMTGALSGTSATFSGDLTIDTNTLYVDSTNNKIGIGTTAPLYTLQINNLSIAGATVPNFDGIAIRSGSYLGTTAKTGFLLQGNIGDNTSRTIWMQYVIRDGSGGALAPSSLVFSQLTQANPTVETERFRLSSTGNGIFTGSVTATSGIFNSITSGSSTFSGSAAAAANVTLLNLENSSDGGVKLNFKNSVASELASITAGVTSAGAGTNDGTLIFRTASDGTASDRLTISSTGAATFSSSISATSATFSGTSASSILTLANTTGGTKADFIITENTGLIIDSYESTTARSIDFRNAGVSALLIASTGAASFSSSVTATALVTSNTESLRIQNDNGYISFWNSANSSRQGYLQIQATALTLSAEGASAFMAFATGGGNERMRITSGGNVGINTSGPTATSTPHFFIGTNMSMFNGASDDSYIGSNFYYNSAWYYRTANAASMIQQNGGEFYFKNAGTGTANGALTWTERMRITIGGNVIIGNAGSAISTRQELRITGNAAGSRISLGLNGTNFSSIITDSGGNVYLQNEYNDSAIKLLMINYNNGVYLSQSATSWTSNSDIRLKNIIGNIENAVSSLMTLRTVKYSWKSDINNKENLGLIAQDVEKVFPEVMDKNKIMNSDDDTEYLGVRYQELVPVLVKAIQELNKKIEVLENR